MMRTGVRDMDAMMGNLPDAGRHAVLPCALTPLIGRELEVSSLVSLLRRDDVRLLTLLGTGGIGKTRLALQVATELDQDFADGAVFVSLASVREPGHVTARVAERLSLEANGDQPLGDRLIHHLRGQELLLVLDNFEQVVVAAPLLADLLLGCPGLKLLVTSRTVLRLSGERVFTVPPLGLPESPSSAAPLSFAGIAQAAAVRLFIERAQAAQQDFTLNQGNVAAVADICARLDGLPLAIELASARTATLPPPALVARMDRLLPLLTSGTRDAPTRQQTMRAVIAWSYDLLSEDERTLFRRLSVFVGGFTLEAAEYVSREPRRLAPDSPPPSPDAQVSVIDGITALVERSLVRPAVETGGEARYGMLETLREFGAEQLAASGDDSPIRDAHTSWFLALAERFVTGSRGGSDRAAGGRIETERGNCLAALAWAIERGQADAALWLASALVPVWLRYGPLSEGQSWLERALALGGVPATRARVVALVVLARIVFLRGDYLRVAALGEEALVLARTTGDRREAARALMVIGEAADRQGDLDRSVRCHEEALGMFRDEGDKRGIAETLSHLGVVAWLRGEVDRFAALAEETHALYREIEDRTGVIAALDTLSLVARLRGELGQQAALASEMISLCREDDDPFVLGSALWTAAAIAGERGEHDTSARFFGAAEALREATGFVLDPAFESEHASAVKNLLSTLGPEAFARSWASGRALGVQAALSGATTMLDRLASLTSDCADSSIEAPGHDLTPRELEVLRLVVEGLTDREIATTLYVARRTVSKHVESILRKLGVSSRGAAASTALRHGLVSRDELD